MAFAPEFGAGLFSLQYALLIKTQIEIAEITKMVFIIFET
jgi:hypothetical protein